MQVLSTPVDWAAPPDNTGQKADQPTAMVQWPPWVYCYTCNFTLDSKETASDSTYPDSSGWLGLQLNSSCCFKWTHLWWTWTQRQESTARAGKSFLARQGARGRLMPFHGARLTTTSRASLVAELSD